MKRILTLSVMASLCALAASAQTTWGGLKFEMSEAEVRSQYGKPLESAANEVGPTLKGAIVNWNWYPEAASAHLKATFSPSADVTFFFDSVSDKLRRIELDVQKPYSDSPETAAIKAGLMLEALTDSLTAKYGPALIVRGNGCGEAFGTTCKRMWRGDGQSITMTWFKDLKLGTLSLLVLEYAAFAPEL